MRVYWLNRRKNWRYPSDHRPVFAHPRKTDPQVPSAVNGRIKLATCVQRYTQVFTHPIHRKAKIVLILGHGRGAIIHLPRLGCTLGDDIDHRIYIKTCAWAKCTPSAKPCSIPAMQI